MIDIYADGAAMDGIVEASKNNRIKGFTTNPSLMKAAGIKDYMGFCDNVIAYLKEHRPDTNISLEVFSDDETEMLEQALKLNQVGLNHDYPVYVKIPVTYTNGEFTINVIQKLLEKNVRVNVTAVFTPHQTMHVLDSIGTSQVPSIISIFAGRIADAGKNAGLVVSECVKLNKFLTYGLSRNPNIKFLWASTRQVYNYVEAQLAGCHVITMTPDVIKKLSNLDKNLTDYSLETVKMFRDDAIKSGYTI
jgi:transaldolase